MEQLNTWLSAIEGFLWGPPLLILLLGTGAYLTIGLKFMPIRCLGQGFRMLLQGASHDQKGEGEITPFQALMTALAATIGTGNIAGVATAIFLGGPGAVFWMWITALVGMASKYAEAVLAVEYREKDARGVYVGGPMYYIKNGLGKNWAWLGTVFAVFGAIAAFGIGNTVQSNSVARAIATVEPGLPYWVTGLVMATLLFVVIIGGIRRIAKVAEKLVPLMAIIYVLGALLILGLNFEQLPAGFARIFNDAFTGTAAVGGFAGAGVMMAIQMGVARGLFSNEAGLGSAPIAHAAARTTDPVRQGMVGMLGTFIDTIIVCSVTALVIVTSGAWDSGVTGAELTTRAFNEGLAGTGGYIVVFGLVVFAFTTIIGWGYYGERCVEYLFGVRGITPFRYLWVAAVFWGAVADLDLIWTSAGITMALMAIPNLLALILLSPIVFKLTQEYLSK